MRPVPVLCSALALALSADASACGGFFCNRDFPIDQAAERIVFAVERGEVTTHVQIAYEGAADDFAWIVPTPGVPELEVSSDALFTTLQQLTQPQFWLYTDVHGVCEINVFPMASEASIDMDDRGSVTVVAEETVGPYDTVTLQAESEEELLLWLRAAGYDLPSDLSAVLAPYVASGQYFVALKLSAGRDAGDLAPLALTYPAEVASIPIQLTSIAAAPDMPLEVYVLGDARAVPDNYLHVRINEASIDWFDGGSNYADVISEAADEAGGQAFATDFSGSTRPLRGMLWGGADGSVDHLRTQDDPIAWLDGVLGLGLPPSSALLELFEDLIPYPPHLEDQGITPQNYYDCLVCYDQHVDRTGFSGAEATDELELRVIDGLRAAEELFARHPHLTRLTSSMDAFEMTVDPRFVYNRDLPQSVSNIHEATVEIRCGMAEGWEGAERVLVLSDGREIPLPSQNWLERNEQTELEAMGELTSPKALVIEDLGASGSGEILFDWRQEAAEAADDFRRPGCSCATGGPGTAGFAALLALGLVRRRRG